MGYLRLTVATLAELIYSARKALGLTHREVAERLGVSRTSVSGWEAGELPAIARIPKIAAVLNIPEADLAIARAEAIVDRALVEHAEALAKAETKIVGARADLAQTRAHFRR